MLWLTAEFSGAQAELHWAEEERAALQLVQLVSIAHPKHGSQGRGSPAQLTATPNTTERKGRVKVWPLAASTGCSFHLCLGLILPYPSLSKPSSGGSATHTGSAWTPDREPRASCSGLSQLGWTERACKRERFRNYLLFAIIFLYTCSPINKPSFLLHIGKGEHDSCNAASNFRSWEALNTIGNGSGESRYNLSPV